MPPRWTVGDVLRARPCGLRAQAPTKRPLRGRGGATAAGREVAEGLGATARPRALGSMPVWSELAQGVADEPFDGGVGVERDPGERTLRLGLAETELDESSVGLRAYVDACG